MRKFILVLGVCFLCLDASGQEFQRRVKPDTETPVEKPITQWYDTPLAYYVGDNRLWQQDQDIIKKHYAQFMRLSNEMISSGMSSMDWRICCAATWAAGCKRIDFEDEYVAIIQHNHPYVRQAARAALKKLSVVDRDNHKAVDFGPELCCTQTEAQAARLIWIDWLAENPRKRKLP